MCVGCSHCGPSRFSPEYNRRFKPENDAGCCCNGSNRNKCDTPSLAIHGTPRAEWELSHGKLITVFTSTFDAQGHVVQTIERVPCPIDDVQKDASRGCSIRYRTNR